jgi:DNA integrity scanning protein DisA with diadenylate cyclase activity
MALTDLLLERVPELDSSFANHVLELAVHWLAPSRIGATIVAHDGESIDWPSLDTSTAARTPQLSVCDRRHFSALTTVLRQHDLAVIVDRDGLLRKVAVGLRWTPDAESAVISDRGMRHRSAQRYSHDHPTATVVVVSEDGPVSVFRAGAVVVTSAGAAT